MAKKVMWQMKEHIFNPSNLSFILGIFPTFQILCETNNTHKRATMGVLAILDKNAPATTTNSRTFAATLTTPVVAFVSTAELQIQKQFQWFYPKSPTICRNYL